MFIDIHTHVFHPKIAHKVVDQLEDHYGIHPVGNGLMEDLDTRMNSAGIDKCVVLAAATAPAQVIPANNWAISIKQEHEEFIPFGTVHTGYKDLEKELDRLEENGIKGLKFHPDFQGFRMDDPALYNIMEMVEDRFVCLFHVGDTLPPEENPSCPRKLAALREAFPKPIIIAAHMGGYRHWDYALDQLAGKDVFVDTSSSMDFLDDAKLETLYRAFGRDHVLFGSDYPLFDAGSELDRLTKRLKLTAADLDAIMENSCSILGL
ncbi:amidohydrolase family protein [Pseudodesulfovibrio cashew]|uniref:Amidohydrolase family protein n=1 Tax=Pseudodesulfovibrio cashew TaxID=2678688 RepID=A0A6I6JE35_9BACT|nr:amidohydrolase family protein [Pseudodesulfovibrio cashew]QGY41095.1 amidohydrolase family protein [Pseudodesulfovibrio cashew]